MSNRFLNDEGKVGVLISPGFGAGWSTWGMCEQQEALLFDSELVQAALASDSLRMQERLEELFGEEVPYSGGWRSIEVKWLSPGTRFYVEEYDGSESLILADDLVHIC